MFGGKYGGGSNPPPRKKLCCADPFKVRFSFIYLILASNPSSKSAFLRHPIQQDRGRQRNEGRAQWGNQPVLTETRKPGGRKPCYAE